MRINTFISSLAVGCLFGVSDAVLAQTTNGPGTNAPAVTMQPHMQSLPGAPAPRPTLKDILSEEQQASFQKASSEKNLKLREMQPKLQAAQREVFEASLASPFDEKLVREKVQAAAQVYADMMMINAKPFSEIQPPLSAEQTEKLKALEAPVANPRIVRGPPPAANHDTNGLPPKP